MLYDFARQHFLRDQSRVRCVLQARATSNQLGQRTEEAVAVQRGHPGDYDPHRVHRLPRIVRGENRVGAAAPACVPAEQRPRLYGPGPDRSEMTRTRDQQA